MCFSYIINAAIAISVVKGIIKITDDAPDVLYPWLAYVNRQANFLLLHAEEMDNADIYSPIHA